MAEQQQPPPEQMREGIFLPNLGKLSKEWQTFLTAQLAEWRKESDEWQVRFDHLTRLLEELRDEVQRLRGLTVTIDRSE